MARGTADQELTTLARIARSIAALPDDEARQRVCEYVFARRFGPWGTIAAVTDHDAHEGTADMLDRASVDGGIADPPAGPPAPRPQARRRAATADGAGAAA